MKERDFVRPPTVAGFFYPEDKRELEKTCRTLLEKARYNIKVKPKGRVFGVVSPHAGYQYSGYTAAYGYALLNKDDYDVVIVVSPSHREYFEGISVFSGKAYSTPLGDIEVDKYLRDSFLEFGGDLVIESRAGHKTEHALEVQLPFLQLTLEHFKLLPIVMGDQRSDYCRALGNVIGDLANGKRILVVASSDLSHYHDYDTANQMDKVCSDDIGRLDPDGLLRHLETRSCEACGGGPIASCLYAANKIGAKESSILYHCNSGDTTGDKSGVVGYLSAIIS
ncbi:MAG: AmmeMemoRadiSam system protein B [Bacteroidetes bacterium]|nr:AmmeMemoRadiSam system protein B [Bacteroidota bacterium]